MAAPSRRDESLFMRFLRSDKGVERELETDGVLGAAYAAVAAVPAFVFVFFDDVGSFVVFLVEGQDIGGAVSDAHAAADAFLFMEYGRHE